MATSKTAVDKTTQDYWTAYFGDYGRLWVREIPRAIKAALVDAGARTAATDAARVTPLGYRVTADRLTLEGRYAAGKTAQLFCAEFTHEGDLVEITALDAPAS